MTRGRTGQQGANSVNGLTRATNHTAHVSAAVLKSSTQPTAALRFTRYLAARDRGLPELARYGFDVVDGDPWALEPELHLLAGAMLRPAIEETLTAFELREGVHVQRVYNGCGILVAQMRAGDRPDAYFACDKSFMSQVADLFPEATIVSNDIPSAPRLRAKNSRAAAISVSGTPA